ncbi:hypothetical protein J4050_04425 [Winogradskyella sp. DF17]|uniref:Lipoprotein n=1 Tax=Winogradskyella pelagia TaxID=2819984 RepID=A0ABS3SZQ7_9FLAO|nr:hypothetical protein [Winogradskyella sp. DF17]MBO3115978.1 hypothetical protein [Winogradskyella sp. DF17]
MKKYVLIFLVAVLATSCNGQTQKKSGPEMAKSDETKDSITRPNERWQVNKEVDENGNVIRYDSIYSWSSNGALKGMDTDSLIAQMQQRMRKQFSMFQGPNHFGFPAHDSIMKQFFLDDFFNAPVDPNFPSMDEMIKQMEAMRQQFFNNRQNYIIPPEPKAKPKDLNKKQI